MSKYFLGSIGDAEAYQVYSNEMTGETSMELVCHCKTMTESAINVAIQKEQIIDSYNGASAGVFYHSPSVTITLSDFLWEPKFLEANFGQLFNKMTDEGNIEYYMTNIVTDSNGFAFLQQSDPEPVRTLLPSLGQQSPHIIIGKAVNSSDWNSYAYDPADRKIYHKLTIAGSTPFVGGLKPNTKYCFKYLKKSLQSRTLNVTTRLMPSELFLRITTPVFAAMDNNGYDNQIDTKYTSEYLSISSGKKVGYLIYEVPRWALDGDSSFNFTMSGTTGVQLTGNVLESIDNEEGSTFMRVREFIQPRVWYEGLSELFWDGDKTEIPDSNTESYNGHIYGIYNDGSCELIESNLEEVRLVFTDLNNISTNSDTEFYNFDDSSYIVNGEFTKGNSGSMKVHPAVVWTNENDNKILVILDCITCDIVRE